MVLPQDQAQASQASNILAEREYRAKLAQYNEDKKKYEKELEEYNKAVAKQKAEAEAKAKAKAKAEAEAKAKADAEAQQREAQLRLEKDTEAKKIAELKEYYAKTPPPKQFITHRGGSRTINPAYTSYWANTPENYLKAQEKERQAKQSVLGATTEQDYKSALWSYRDTNYVKSITTIKTPNYDRIRSAGMSGGQYYGKGSDLNRALNQDQFTFMGGSQAEWQSIIAQENRDRANSQKQSASLRAVGNAQIQAAQQVELQRLGATQKADGTWSNPTKVSATLGSSGKLADIQASGVAVKAQDFPASFQYNAPKPQTNSPLENWNAIADPNATGFRAIEKPQAPLPPQKDEHIKNRLAPALIPIPQRSNIGYAKDGSPLQGPAIPQGRFSVSIGEKTRTFKDYTTAQKFVERYGSQKSVITPIGLTEFAKSQGPQMLWEVQTPRGKQQFATEQEANQFIQNEEKKKPFTDAKILPLESLYQWVNKGAEANQKITQERPNDFIAATMAGGSAIQAGLLNAVTVGGKLIDKHILKQPTKETRLITTPVTYYDKGFDKTFEGALTGTAPYIHTEKISIKRGFDAAKEQWNKQTPAQNFGQSLAIAPVVVFDAVTLGQGGLAVGRAIARPLGKLTQKVASPTLVNKVVNAPTKTFGSKPEIVKKPLIIQPRKPYQVSGEELYTQFKSQERITGTTKLTPNKNVRADPDFTTPTRASEVQQSTGIIPKENIVGEIKLSKGFVPNKPERPFVGKQQKPVQEDPFYKPASRANEIDLSDSAQILFKKDTVSLRGVGQVKRPKSTPDYSRTKEFADFQNRVDPNVFTSQKISFTATAKLPKKTRTPNYITASSDFVDFQKSLVRKPTRYTNIVGEIKLSKGFIPNKYPTPIRRNFPKGEKPVQEDPFYQNKMPMERLGGNKPSTKNIKKKSSINKLLKDDDAIEKTFKGTRIEGGQASGSSTIQIMKPQVKKATVQSKRLLQKKNNPTPIARDFTRPDGDRVVQVRSSSRQPILLLRPAQQKKKKPLQSTRTRQSQVYATESLESVRVGSKSRLGLSTGITSKEKLRQRESYKATPILSTRVNVAIAQPQKSQQKTKPALVLRTPTPEKTKPVLRQKPIFRSRAPTRQVQRTTSPIPRKQRVVAASPIDKKENKKRRRKDDEKTNDFLGNTRLGNIEGLFRRTDVIHGDRKISRQIKKDNKAKFGEGKVRIF